MQGSLPPTMSKAVISVLLKKGNDPMKFESYRPISLLCCDYKILTRALDIRLEVVMPTIIHPDQTGFIKGRRSFGNLRRIFNVLYSPNSSPTPEALISLDAQKAFDRIEFEYLFTAHERFGFGPTFVLWITELYSVPQASVRTNSTLTIFLPA